MANHNIESYLKSAIVSKEGKKSLMTNLRSTVHRDATANASSDGKL